MRFQNKMKKVFITGISGTGKTSIAQALRGKGINAFDMDMYDLCYWVNINDGIRVDYEAVLNRDFIDSHMWVCDVEKLKSMLNSDEDVVMLGHPENYQEILPLFDKFILLHCEPETFLKRIMAREDNDFGKDETAQQHLLDTYKEFENNMLSRGATPINVEGSKEEVVQKIISEINK
jgi:broad-specificity NMP kinase